jgi:hypothetical protein
MRTRKEVFNFGSGFIDRHEGMKLLGSSNCNYIYMLFIQVPLLSYTPDFLKIEFMFGMHSSQNWQSAAGVKLCLSYGFWRLALAANLLTNCIGHHMVPFNVMW